jgi:hypothetical protein
MEDNESPGQTAPSGDANRGQSAEAGQCDNCNLVSDGNPQPSRSGDNAKRCRVYTKPPKIACIQLCEFLLAERAKLFRLILVCTKVRVHAALAWEKGIRTVSSIGRASDS